ncbi:unnamed protein product [Adineta ricciae]|uniref:Uncharacterized protein n=1 Tax=Adineta ricciae TaxID=249248 RepID=A0A814VTH4_ADIRI|nr:unnamed protein product [Adineta ricciae]CAF1194904.1 unnamed protein product [Adineta ricciae]
MGIPGFSSWLDEKYPSIITPCTQENGKASDDNRIQVDNLYLDMNEIIHSCFDSDDSSTVKNEDEIIEAVFRHIDEIVSVLHPRKLIYMALDGVASKAKMHCQRVHLFLRAKNDPDDIGQFTKCDIKPGTKFMAKLSNKLQSYILKRMNQEDSVWKSIIVILSDANVPGEGEHKIMDFIRSQRYSNPKTNHVLFSGDSDVILLGLTMHSNHIRIMRRKTEETKSYTFRDLRLLRQEIIEEFGGNLERVIDDWIFMCLLAGNDYLPNLPSIGFNRNELDNTLFNTYKEYIRKRGGYLIENMQPDLRNFKILLQRIGENEEENVVSLLEHSQTSVQYSVDKVREQDKDPPLRFGPSPPQKAKSSASSIQTVTNWQRQYYKDKFGFTEDQLRTKSMEVAHDYAKGLRWILECYYNGIPSWNWYYPHYYPPLPSTLSNLESIPDRFSSDSKPLTPLEEMLATFPSKYARYLPEKWQPLMQNIESPIIDFYRTDPAIDTHGKRYEKQYIVKLPFIDEKRLFEALSLIDSTLSEEEKERNRVDDDHRLFIHSTNPYYQQFINSNGTALDVNTRREITRDHANNKDPQVEQSGTETADSVVCLRFHGILPQEPSS